MLKTRRAITALSMASLASAASDSDRRTDHVLWLARLAILAVIGTSLAGCVDLGRLSAVPMTGTKQATVLGIPNARYVVDDAVPASLAAEFRRAYEREARYADRLTQLPTANYLAISGGGDNGAFGAGLLVGWTESGTRPAFKAVTGISTGALIAPFAFLGPQYDPILAQLYTTINQKDIFEKRPLLAAIVSDAMADTTPLYALISRYLDGQMIEHIAREYEKGRLLLIGTTNLDAGRPVIWNIGAIAQSRNPNAPNLIRRILLASAAIPAAFPPVMFEVSVDGAIYQELHADGGATAQTFLYPANLASAYKHGIPARTRVAYVIRNGKLLEDWNETERKTLSIASRAVSTLTTSSGVGDLYRIYATTKRDGVGFRLAFIEPDFRTPHPAEFDHDYMNSLFDYARLKARAGYPWRKGPPGFAQ